MPGSAINIKANAQEVINLKRKIDELKASLLSMKRESDPKAYDRLNNELFNTTKRFNDLQLNLQKYTSQQNIANQATQTTTSGLGALNTGIAKIGGVILAVGAAIAKLTSVAMEFAAQGIAMATQAQGVKRAFDGLNDPTLLDGLRKSTKGTINDLELMKAAVQAQNFGIPVQKLGGLLQFAQQRAADTGQSVDYLVDSIVTGLGRKSIKILDNLQINVAELQKRAKKTGDFMGTAIDMINEKLKEQGDYVLSAADKEQIAAAKRENAQLKVGNALLGIRVIWNEIIASAFDSIGALAERYLPLLVKRIEGVVNKFIDWYNTSETLRAAIGGVYVIFTAVFANIKKDVKIAIDAMGAFADVMSNIGSPAKALEAYNNFIKNFAQNTAQATLEVSKSINEAKQLAGKKMGHVSLEYTIGSSKYTPGLENTKDVDPKAEKRAQRIRDAALKLLNMQAELDSESVKQQLEYEQKLLDIEQDSFDKRYRQNQLNMAKELIATEEFRQKMIKDQQEAAKNIYIKNNGTDTGFNFATFDKTLLPQGLSDADIESQIKKRTDASLAAWKKGNEDIAKEQRAFADEEKLTFASQLDQQIYSIRKHYKERRDLAKGNSDLIKQIEKNESREIIAARLQAHQRQLESDASYNQKVMELINDRYAFESDKRKDSLQQQISDQEELIRTIEDRLANDPNNADLANELRMAKIELALFNKELAKTKTEKFSEIANTAAQIASELRGALGDFGVKLSDDTNKALDGFESILKGAGDLAEGIATKNPAKIISGVIEQTKGYFNAISGILGSADYSAYDKLKSKYENLLEIWNELIDKKKEYLSTSAADEVKRVEKETLDLINKQTDAVKKLAQARLDSGKSAGSHSLWYRMWKGSYKFDGMNWRDVAADIENQLGVSFDSMSDMLNMSADRLQWIKENYSGLWAVMDGDFRGYLDQLIQYGDQAKEAIEAAKETLTGISFDSMKDNFLNTLLDMDSDAKDFTDDFTSYFQKAIMKRMLDNQFASRLQSFYDSFAQANKENGIDSGEYNSLQNIWQNIVNDAIKERDKLKDIFGWQGSQTPSSGYSVSMSQDTGDKLVGIATGSQMRLISLDQNVARIAQWNQPVSEKFNFDTIAMPLGALSQSSLRIERMMEENRNIAIQMFYLVRDIKGDTANLSAIKDGINSMNSKLDNI